MRWAPAPEGSASLLTPCALCPPPAAHTGGPAGQLWQARRRGGRAGAAGGVVGRQRPGLLCCSLPARGGTAATAAHCLLASLQRCCCVRTCSAQCAVPHAAPRTASRRAGGTPRRLFCVPQHPRLAPPHLDPRVGWVRAAGAGVPRRRAACVGGRWGVAGAGSARPCQPSSLLSLQPPAPTQVHPPPPLPLQTWPTSFLPPRRTRPSSTSTLTATAASASTRSRRAWCASTRCGAAVVPERCLCAAVWRRQGRACAPAAALLAALCMSVPDAASAAGHSTAPPSVSCPPLLLRSASPTPRSARSWR